MPAPHYCLRSRNRDCLLEREFSNRSLTQLPVPLEARSNQDRNGNDPDRPGRSLRELVQWATTPPQAIAVYLICFLLVADLSFYVGTLKPKKAVGTAPPPLTAPRN
jgi:hypothetical protein